MTAFFIATTALASIIAAYFAWDGYRVRDDRNEWALLAKRIAIVTKQMLEERPARGPNGRFVKRAK